MTGAEAWQGYVGSQTPDEFWTLSQKRGHTTPEEACAAYAQDIPNLFDDWDSSQDLEEIGRLLARYLRTHLPPLIESITRGERRMTYTEVLQSLQDQGYEIVSTGGATETIDSHLADLENDPDDVIYGESEGGRCLLVYALPDQEHPLCRVYRRDDYLRHYADQGGDIASEVVRLGLSVAYRAAYCNQVRLTGPEHQHLSDAELLAEGIAEAGRQGLIGPDEHQIRPDQIRIGIWRGDRW